MGPQFERIQFEITPKLHVGDDKQQTAVKYQSSPRQIYIPRYTVPMNSGDDYTRAKTAFLHPSKEQFIKKSFMPYHRQLFLECIKSFRHCFMCVSSNREIYTFAYQILTEK